MSDYQYDPNSGYYPAGKKKQKRHTGLLAVLLVLAVLTAAASWVVNFLDLQAQIGPNGLSISFGNQKEPDVPQQPDEPDQPETPEPQPTEDPPAEDPQSELQPTEDETLQKNPSTPGVENVPFDQEGALSLQDIYEKSIPSVASIICTKRGGMSTGTGIVMSEDGYVITNFHVIDGAQEIQVLLGDNRYYDAELVGGDEPTDLAVLKIEAYGLIPAEFGDSDVLRVGDLVVAIGDPLGTELRGTMTDGIISAINRDLEINGRHMTLIQTNAALNSGNSGGPLINCYGQVIGINTVKMIGGSASAEGLGFAIPINIAKPIIDELVKRGYVSGRPAIGVECMTLDVRTQFFYNLPAGVIITAVEEGSDAQAKGLTPDDVIVSFNDMRISSVEELAAAKEATAAGDTVTLIVYRRGSYYEVPVVLMDQTRPELQ
jgi:serine protease Do